MIRRKVQLLMPGSLLNPATNVTNAPDNPTGDQFGGVPNHPDGISVVPAKNGMSQSDPGDNLVSSESTYDQGEAILVDTSMDIADNSTEAVPGGVSPKNDDLTFPPQDHSRSTLAPFLPPDTDAPPAPSSADRGFTPFPTSAPMDDKSLPPHNNNNNIVPAEPNRPSHPTTPIYPPAQPPSYNYNNHQGGQLCSTGSLLCTSFLLVDAYPLTFVILLLLFCCCCCKCCCKRSLSDRRGEYRAVAAHMTDSGFDNAFGEDYSDDEEYDSEDEFGWTKSRNAKQRGRAIEMKRMGDAEDGNLSLHEMNG